MIRTNTPFRLVVGAAFFLSASVLGILFGVGVIDTFRPAAGGDGSDRLMKSAALAVLFWATFASLCGAWRCRRADGTWRMADWAVGRAGLFIAGIYGIILLKALLSL
ncbi:MAG: hypothetical protein AAGJ97_09885 [Planctomycetota bacterium]